MIIIFHCFLLDALNIVRAKSVSGVFKFNVQLPTISSQHEIDALIPVLQSTIYAAQENSARDGLTINVGACLEVPRCCLKAEKVIKELDLDFVSFGTDRLTELVRYHIHLNKYLNDRLVYSIIF